MGKDLEDLGVRSLSFENCEQAALLIRQRLGLNEVEPVPHISGVLTSLGFECVVRSTDEMSDRDAFAIPDRNEIHFRQDVFEDVLEDKPAARSTAAHEIAHGSCHEGQTRLFKMAGGNVLLPFLSDDESAEVQADRIGRAFLMPRAMVEKFTSARELAAHARVPVSEAIERIKELSIRSARSTPLDLATEIERQRAIANVSAGFARAKSVLDPKRAALIAWELAPLAEDLPDDEYRCIAGRYIIRWSRYGMMLPGGWRLSGGVIVPWESETRG